MRGSAGFPTCGFWGLSSPQFESCKKKNWRLESRQNPQTGRSALHHLPYYNIHHLPGDNDDLLDGFAGHELLHLLGSFGCSFNRGVVGISGDLDHITYHAHITALKTRLTDQLSAKAMRPGAVPPKRPPWR